MTDQRTETLNKAEVLEFCGEIMADLRELKGAPNAELFPLIVSLHTKIGKQVKDWYPKARDFPFD